MEVHSSENDRPFSSMPCLMTPEGKRKIVVFNGTNPIQPPFSYGFPMVCHRKEHYVDLAAACAEVLGRDLLCSLDVKHLRRSRDSKHGVRGFVAAGEGILCISKSLNDCTHRYLHI